MHPFRLSGEISNVCQHRNAVGYVFSARFGYRYKSLQNDIYLNFCKSVEIYEVLMTKHFLILISKLFILA